MKKREKRGSWDKEKNDIFNTPLLIILISPFIYVNLK